MSTNNPILSPAVVPGVLAFKTFAALKNKLKLAGQIGILFSSTGQYVGAWVHNGTRLDQLGPVDLTACATLEQAVVNVVTSPTSFTVVGGHNLPTSAKIRALIRATGTEEAEGLVATVVGNAVTLPGAGAPSIAPGDHIVTLRSMSSFSVGFAATRDIQLYKDTELFTLVNGSGLYMRSTTAYAIACARFRLFTAGIDLSKIGTIYSQLYGGSVNLNINALNTSSMWAAGIWEDDSNIHGGGGFANVAAAAYRSGVCTGSVAAPALTATAVNGTAVSGVTGFGIDSAGNQGNTTRYHYGSFAGHPGTVGRGWLTGTVAGAAEVITCNAFFALCRTSVTGQWCEMTIDRISPLQVVSAP